MLQPDRETWEYCLLLEIILATAVRKLLNSRNPKALLGEVDNKMSGSSEATICSLGPSLISSHIQSPMLIVTETQ